MKITFSHNNINVHNLEKSISFYKEALNLAETRRIEAPDNSFIIVFLSDGITPHSLELTWLRDFDRAYNLGDNEFHLAFSADEFDKLRETHRQMGCICYENEAMGIYFISDPDGYWIEIVPARKAASNA